ncbi:MAG: hypothetical protein UT24_C0033G0021 [Candidatus Woesebacteria bacterium GW2011_GWB1_39_12]|uniref:Uncharacterized protein n=1 Tax=Candidatus Woesebacteria bacterium GW2011_GWB1_39_12 TaxID=1618574 RepID=A0A0G0QAZ5_9BACT|nr:MAG: hypothetical protein UT24_C0033G0021 [Candidatus Woesebacteria bacterium GW2011_GWB1_39_12]
MEALESNFQWKQIANSGNPQRVRNDAGGNPEQTRKSVCRDFIRSAQTSNVEGKEKVQTTNNESWLRKQ